VKEIQIEAFHRPQLSGIGHPRLQEEFTDSIAGMLDRPVADETGLTMVCDLNLNMLRPEGACGQVIVDHLEKAPTEDLS